MTIKAFIARGGSGRGVVLTAKSGHDLWLKGFPLAHESVAALSLAGCRSVDFRRTPPRFVIL
jgi:hypothetical protein